MSLATTSDTHDSSTIPTSPGAGPRSATRRRQRLEALTREAEALARAHPAQYRRRVALLALLGYVVLGGTVTLLIALVAGSVWAAVASPAVWALLVQKKLGIAVIVLVWMLGRALWVRIEPPAGRPLTRAVCPALFADIDAICARLNAPAIHSVVLTPEFNASIAQTPRLGSIGPHRVTLVVGLELMLALSRRQACAVLAHEIGHLSRAHGRLGNWIYRLRITWQRLMQAFDDQSGVVTRLLRKFFDWYAPYFNAYSFALARSSEFEADQLSARATTAQTAAAALVSTATASQSVSDQFWKATYRRADEEAEPPADVFIRLDAFVDAWRADPKASLTRLRAAIAERTDFEDTHPALIERLDALGEYPRVQANSGASAARAWLGANYERVLREESQKWAETVRDGWSDRHRAARRARAELQLLEARDPGTLTREESWNLATWTKSFDAARDPLPRFAAYAAAYPDDRNADYAIGEIKLARGDRTGLFDLERALERHQLVLPACALAYDFLRRQHEPALAEQWLQRSEAQIDRYGLARDERESLRPDDEIEPCSLDVAQSMALSTQLGQIKGLERAWIAQKRLAQFPDEPVFVLAYESRGWLTRRARLHAELSERIDWPGPTFFVPRGGSLSRVHAKVRTVGSPIIGS